MTPDVERSCVLIELMNWRHWPVIHGGPLLFFHVLSFNKGPILEGGWISREKLPSFGFHLKLKYPLEALSALNHYQLMSLKVISWHPAGTRRRYRRGVFDSESPARREIELGQRIAWLSSQSCKPLQRVKVSHRTLRSPLAQRREIVGQSTWLFPRNPALLNHCN